MEPTARDLLWMDRGQRLQARMPNFYYWCHIKDGVVVRRVDEHTLEPEDVITGLWSEIGGISEFQNFLDTITELTTGERMVEDGRISQSKS